MNILESAARTEQDTRKFRFLALAVVALALLLSSQYVPVVPIVTLVIAYLVYSYVLRQILIPRYMGYPLAYGMLAVDSLAVLVALYYIGPIGPVFILLPMLVVYYALYLGYIGALAGATVASLGYSGVTFLLGEGSALGERLSVQVPLFYMIALLVGYLAQQRFKEREEKLALQRLIAVETRARSLLEMVDSLGSRVDIAVLAQDIARMAALIGRVPYSLVLLPDEEEKVLVGRAATFPLETLGMEQPEALVEPTEADGVVARAWRAGEVVSSGPEGQPAWAQALGARFLLAVPILSDGDRLGVICLLDREERTLTWEELEGLKVFSQAAARLLGSAQLYPKTQRRGARLVAELKETVERLGRFRDLRGRQSIQVGSFSIEPARERVTSDGQELPLTKTEFEVLYLLAEKAGSVVGPDTILREVWGPDFAPQGNVVDVSIHRLRRKLARYVQGGNPIRTVRGKGYILSPPGSRRPAG